MQASTQAKRDEGKSGCKNYKLSRGISPVFHRRSVSLFNGYFYWEFYTVKTETLLYLSCQALKLGIRSSSEQLFLESITAVSIQGAAQTYLICAKMENAAIYFTWQDVAPIGETGLNKHGALLLEYSTVFSCLNGAHVCLI